MGIATVVALMLGLAHAGTGAFLAFRGADQVTSETVGFLFAGGLGVALCAYLISQIEQEPIAVIVLVVGSFIEVTVVRTLLKWKRRAT